MIVKDSIKLKINKDFTKDQFATSYRKVEFHYMHLVTDRFKIYFSTSPSVNLFSFSTKSFKPTEQILRQNQ